MQRFQKAIYEYNLGLRCRPCHPIHPPEFDRLLSTHITFDEEMSDGSGVNVVPQSLNLRDPSLLNCIIVAATNVDGADAGFALCQ